MQTHETNRGKWIENNICVEELTLKATQVTAIQKEISLKSNALNQAKIQIK